MAQSISRPFEPAQGKKEGVRCEHPDPNRPSGVCGKLLMEVRNGQLGIAHRTEEGDHFTPLNVLLGQAEQQEWLPKTTKGRTIMKREPTTTVTECLKELLKRTRAYKNHLTWFEIPRSLHNSHTGTRLFVATDEGAIFVISETPRGVDAYDHSTYPPSHEFRRMSSKLRPLSAMRDSIGRDEVYDLMSGLFKAAATHAYGAEGSDEAG